MGLFGLVFLAVLLAIVVLGIAIGLVVCAIGCSLVALGVISSSVFVGLRSGRRAGLRFFLVQCGVWGGVPAGAVIAWCVQALIKENAIGWSNLAFGAVGGAMAGVAAALLLDALGMRLFAWLSNRVIVPCRQRRIA